MDQIKFIIMANNIHPEGEIEQTPDGIVIVNLRSQIQITHNYKRKNEMRIIFNDSKIQYIISNKSELEEIYRMHLANTDVVQMLHDYCKNNLKVVK